MRRSRRPVDEAPTAGTYHFDLGVRIDHVAPSLSCAYTFSLVQLRGDARVRSYELLVLEQSTVDVGDSARRNPVMRQTAWRLRDSAAITLPLGAGDAVEVHAQPNHELCGGQGRVAPTDDGTVISYFSGYQIR